MTRESTGTTHPPSCFHRTTSSPGLNDLFIAASPRSTGDADGSPQMLLRPLLNRCSSPSGAMAESSAFAASAAATCARSSIVASYARTADGQSAPSLSAHARSAASRIARLTPSPLNGDITCGRVALQRLLRACSPTDGRRASHKAAAPPSDRRVRRRGRAAPATSRGTRPAAPARIPIRPRPSKRPASPSSGTRRRRHSAPDARSRSAARSAPLRSPSARTSCRGRRAGRCRMPRVVQWLNSSSTNVTPQYNGTASVTSGRTRDHVPSAPTTMSKLSTCPFSKSSSTRPSSRRQGWLSLCPHRTTPGGNESRRIRRSSARSTSGRSRSIPSPASSNRTTPAGSRMRNP